MKAKEQSDLLTTLQTRFENNMHRHNGLKWTAVQEKLSAQPEKIMSLLLMEITGGEPDVIGYATEADAYLFCDCSVESPKGRRSLCYDRKALESRKQHRPTNCALDLASEMGIDLLTESQYRELQSIEAFDTKSSSWLATPPDIRDLGGALFGDRRYGHTFIYHNGAESYYAARGFRGLLKV